MNYEKIVIFAFKNICVFMIKKIILIAFVFMPMTIIAQNQNVDVEKQLAYCHSHVKKALGMLKPFGYTIMPRNILKNDKRKIWNCRPAMAEEWCSGFWAGILWMDYAYSNDSQVKEAAQGYTAELEFLANRPAYDHDLGFIIINSFLKGVEMTHDSHYKQVALQCADTLATLFNPTVGTMLSWPRHVKDYKGHNTIMDNMINMELLLWAAENGGNQQLRDIAIKHSITTMKHHFRKDGSSYHVAVYNQRNGKFKRGVTHQGFANWSMWSRGQAWAIYGYTMVYRYTHDPVFLEQAKKVTDIYLKRLNETSNDWIPIWDMDDPRGIAAPKDASAACIVASALIELSQFVEDEKRDEYMKDAVNMLTDLSSDSYLSGDDNVAFLKHSTGHHPAGSEIDASIIYADYYYIEALLRLRSFYNSHN